MTRCLRPLLACLATALVAGCAGLGQPLPPSMSVEDVVQASRSGMPADEIVRRIRESGSVFHPSAAELVRLHQRGVPDAVLDVMQQTGLEAVRRQESLLAWSAYNGRWGWPGWGYGPPYRYPHCWPHPCWW